MEYYKSEKRILNMKNKIINIAILSILIIITNYKLSFSFETKEVVISSQEDNCDYMYYNKKTFNYPKIKKIRDNVFVYYFDATKNSILKKNIENLTAGRAEYIYSDRNEMSGSVPMLQIENNITSFLLLSKKDGGKECEYSIKEYEPGEKKWVTKNDISLCEKNKQKKIHIDKIMPFKNDSSSFLATGYYTEYFFKPIAIFSGEFPSFTKNFSISFRDQAVGDLQKIEDDGRFGGSDSFIYEQSEYGEFYSAWIRNNKHIAITNNTWFESICLSKKIGYAKWDNPKVIYTINNINIDPQLKNLSIATCGKSLFVIWEDSSAGILFADINNDIIAKPIIISGNKYITALSPNYNQSDFLWNMHTSKIVVGENGDIYVLWIQNIGKMHKIALSIRRGLKWEEPLIISEDIGPVKLPDILIDENNKVHITYIKKYDGRWDCYYRKVDI